MSKKAQLILFDIVDNPKKRKQVIVVLIIILVFVVGAARFVSQENTKAGQVIQKSDLAGLDPVADEKLNSVNIDFDADQTGQSGQTGLDEVSEDDDVKKPVAVFVDVGGA